MNITRYSTTENSTVDNTTDTAMNAGERAFPDQDTLTLARKLRRWPVVVAPFLMAIIGALAFASPASAYVYASGGQPGTSYSPRPTCSHKPVWGAVQLSAPAPTIYARNYRSGSGNDFQPVRYRVFVVDYSTGQTVASTGYSGTVWAWDNSPAQFSGGPALFNLNARGRYRLDYRVEYLSSSGSLLGWTADRVTSYDYIDRYQRGRLGPIDSCAVAG